MRFELRSERHGLRLSPALVRYEKRRERQAMVPLAIREYWQELREQSLDDNRDFDQYMGDVLSTMLLDEWRERQAQPYHGRDDCDFDDDQPTELEGTYYGID